jgi:hypothetical protein
MITNTVMVADRGQETSLVCNDRRLYKAWKKLNGLPLLASQNAPLSEQQPLLTINQISMAPAFVR